MYVEKYMEMLDCGSVSQKLPVGSIDGRIPPEAANFSGLGADHLPINAITSVLQLLCQEQTLHDLNVMYGGGEDDTFTTPGYSYFLSAGSKGYCAFKEMLQNGVVGNTLLLESHDLRNVDEHSEHVFFRVRTIHNSEVERPSWPRSDNKRKDAFQRLVDMKICEVDAPDNNYDPRLCITVFSNTKRLPDVLDDEFRLHPIELDLSHLTKQTKLHFGPWASRSLVGLKLSQYTETLPEFFLRGCRRLKALDLSPLSNVNLAEFPGGFLWGCSALTELPMGFLAECTGLTELNMHPLMNLTKLPVEFLSGCSGLKTLDLSPLSHLTELCYGFLEGCSGLKTLDLSPLSKVAELLEGFLEGCSGLETLDLSPFSNVTELPEGFLMECSGLKTLDLSLFSHLKELPSNFLEGCSGIQTLDLSPFSHLMELPTNFLAHCSGLKTLNLSPLSNVNEVSYGFLEGCSGLKTLDLSPFSHLALLPSKFLKGCSGLETVDLSPLSNVTELPYGFLEGCSGMHTLNMSPILNVTGESLRGYLTGFIHLESITLSSSHDDRIRTDIANSMPNITIVYV